MPGRARYRAARRGPALGSVPATPGALNRRRCVRDVLRTLRRAPRGRPPLERCSRSASPHRLRCALRTPAREDFLEWGTDGRASPCPRQHGGRSQQPVRPGLAERTRTVQPRRPASGSAQSARSPSACSTTSVSYKRTLPPIADSYCAATRKSGCFGPSTAGRARD